MDTGDTLQLVVHVWGRQVHWMAFTTPRFRQKVLVARGHLDRDADSPDDTALLTLLLAASDAYRHERV